MNLFLLVCPANKTNAREHLPSEKIAIHPPDIKPLLSRYLWELRLRIFTWKTRSGLFSWMFSPSFFFFFFTFRKLLSYARELPEFTQQSSHMINLFAGEEAHIPFEKLHLFARKHGERQHFLRGTVKD